MMQHSENVSALKSSMTTVIKPDNGWIFSDLQELLRYRDLLITLAWRDVKLRYKQTALGVIWVVLQPLLGAIIFQIVFGRLAKTPTQGVPSYVFYFAGYMFYKTFETTLTKSSVSLVGNVNLVSKVYFPRLILPLSTAFGTMLDFAVSCGVLATLMVVFHTAPSPAVFLLPIWLLGIQVFALGIGFFTSALTVQFRDVQYVVPILIQMGQYAAPVAYSVSFAAEKLPASLQWILWANPMAGLLDASRWSVLGTPIYSMPLLVWSMVAALLVFVLGIVFFTRVERRLVDVI